MGNRKKALVLGGKTGLVGQALVAALQEAGWDVLVTTRKDVDFSSCNAYDALAGIVEREHPHCLFNCVGYTAVDAAEDDPQTADILNRQVPALLARVGRNIPFQLVHYSTDFVFDGNKDAPYGIDDATNPLSVYGRTKRDGENELLAAGLTGCMILRTAWLFGPGRGNFVRTIINKCRELPELRVVHDQIGSPTYTLDLAAYTLALVDVHAEGLFHVVNSGEASWCELADEAVAIVMPDCAISPVPSSAYPQKAKRPGYSVLSTERLTTLTGIVPRPWPQALREYVYKEFFNE